MLTHVGKNRLLIKKLTRKLTADGFQKVTASGLTTDFDEAIEKPLFISDYPFEDGHSIFDCFFNLDTN